MSHDAEYAALVGIDWADTKHDFCLRATGAEQEEYGVMGHLPEAIDPDFSARHSERLSKRVSGSRAMKVRETKEVLATISSACSSRHDWDGGKPGSSKLQDAQTRLRSVRLRSQKPFDHKYFHGYFAWKPHAPWP